MSESASIKSAKFGDDPVAGVRLFYIPNRTDAEEEACAAVESPTKNHKAVSNE